MSHNCLWSVHDLGENKQTEKSIQFWKAVNHKAKGPTARALTHTAIPADAAGKRAWNAAQKVAAAHQSKGAHCTCTHAHSQSCRAADNRPRIWRRKVRRLCSSHVTLIVKGTAPQRTTTAIRLCTPPCRKAPQPKSYTRKPSAKLYASRFTMCKCTALSVVTCMDMPKTYHPAVQQKEICIYAAFILWSHIISPLHTNKIKGPQYICSGKALQSFCPVAHDRSKGKSPEA